MVIPGKQITNGIFVPQSFSSTFRDYAGETVTLNIIAPPSPTPTVTPTATATPTPTATVTPTASVTPTLSVTPTISPSSVPATTGLVSFWTGEALNYTGYVPAENEWDYIYETTQDPALSGWGIYPYATLAYRNIWSTLDDNPGISIPIDNTALGNTYSIPVKSGDAVMIQQGQLIQLTNDSPLAWVKGTVTSINSGILISGTTDVYYASNFDLQVSSFNDGSAPSTVYITGSNTYIDYPDSLMVMQYETPSRVITAGKDMHSYNLRQDGITHGTRYLGVYSYLEGGYPQIANTIDTSVIASGDTGTLNLNIPIIFDYLKSGKQKIYKVKDAATWFEAELSNYDPINLTVDYTALGTTSTNTGTFSGWVINYIPFVTPSDDNGSIKVKFYCKNRWHHLTNFQIAAFSSTPPDPNVRGYTATGTFPSDVVKKALVGHNCQAQFTTTNFSGVVDLSDCPSSFNEAYLIYPNSPAQNDMNNNSIVSLSWSPEITEINMSGSKLARLSVAGMPNLNSVDFTDWSYSELALKGAYFPISISIGGGYSPTDLTNLSEANCQQIIDVVMSGIYNIPPNWNDTYSEHPWLASRTYSAEVVLRSANLTEAQKTQISDLQSKMYLTTSRIRSFTLKSSN